MRELAFSHTICIPLLGVEKSPLKLGKLLTTTNDGKHVREFLEDECRFPQPQWFREESSSEEIQAVFDKMIKNASRRSKENQKALYFVYYSGHGALIDGKTVGYTNSEEVIELETNVRKLALFPNSYVVALFDCCRDIHQQTRGGQVEDPLPRYPGQLYIIHAVAPGKKAVSVKSAYGIAQVNIFAPTSTTFKGVQ